jgi:membrane fusion protein (multidrug efflux system)
MPDDGQEAALETRSWMQRRRGPLLLVAPLLVALAGGAVWLTGGRTVSTDDATIQVARTEISSMVAGQVAKLLVSDNQMVHQGDLLFTLDDRAFRIGVAEARAALASTKLQIAALKATYQQRQADRRVALDMAELRHAELARQRRLATAGIAAQAQLEQAEHAARAAELQIAVSEESINNAKASLDGNPDIDIDNHPAVLQAQAQLDRALLSLSYATIRAPSDGIVTQVDQLQVGDMIAPATALFSLMSSSAVWAEANFKETDLTYLRPGQSASIEIDSYPGQKFPGQVVSVSPGTGSSFSLLPPENASGNWVKVVQRLPVRIAFAPLPANLPLRAGLSAVVTVDTQHRRSWFGQGAAAP